MYLAIITLPLLGAISSGLIGRKIGVTGAQLITSGSVIITCFLALIAFYEVGLSLSPVSIKLFSWIDSESLTIDWGFNFDALTVSMLIPVLIVSALVHVYSIGYMSEDPHQQRFFSYLSMFTFFMLILVTGDNYLVMFIGWEGVGISSYLLVSFWFTRVQANKSAISALLFNRVGDMFLTIGLFALIFALGNIDYAVVFSIAPYLNENIVTIVGICFLIGAMAKSAQIGLHVWLPQAMEGQKNGSRCGQNKKNYSGLNSRYNYNIKIKKEQGLLLLKNKLAFSNLILINNNKRFLSSKKIKTSCLSPNMIVNLNPIQLQANKDLLDAIVGDLLGDGSIGMGNHKRWPNTNGRLEFTFSIANLAYLQHLKFNVYSSICTKTLPTPWPNILTYPNKTVTQYWFSSRRLPFITEIHKIWYLFNEDSKKGEAAFIKILPSNISSLLKPIGLAHWIMGDGYTAKGTVYLCTDNFTKKEVEHLIIVLKENFGLIAKIQKRTRPTGIICWRIGFDRSSIDKLKELVVPYFIPEMLYKLNTSRFRF